MGGDTHVEDFLYYRLSGRTNYLVLLSRQLIDGMIQSVYEAPSTCFNRTYHLVTIEVTL